MLLAVLRDLLERALRSKLALTIVATLCFALPSVWRYCARKYELYVAAAKFPGPRAWPILGNALDMVTNREDLLNKGIAWAKEFSAPYRCWMGPELYIVVHNARDIKEILHSPKGLEKSPVGNFAQDFFGNGIVTAPASTWRIHRKLISPAFSSRTLASYATIFAAKSRQMLDLLAAESHGRRFRITPYVSACALGMILDAALGISLELDGEDLLSYDHALHSLFDVLMTRVSHIWLHPDVIFNRTSLGRKNRRDIKYMSAMAEKAIRQRNILQSRKTSSKDENCDIGTKSNLKLGSGAFLDVLTEANQDGSYYTEAEFKHEINTMIAAGAHTVSSHMDFMLRLLASYPEIQEKVWQELHGIYGSVDPSLRAVKLEDLPRLEYLECVIKESMRLFPPVPFVLRDIREDLDIGSCVLPRGSTAALFIFGLHRNEDYWPDPLKFDPDRFRAENVASQYPGSYVPFSLGPRNCIGLKYATMSIKITTATLLRRYALRVDEFVPAEEMKLRPSTVLQFAEPWNVRIEERRRREAE